MRNENLKKNIEAVINQLPDSVFVGGSSGKTELIDVISKALIPHKTVYVCELSEDEYNIYCTGKMKIYGCDERPFNISDILHRFKKKEVEV